MSVQTSNNKPKPRMPLGPAKVYPPAKLELRYESRRVVHERCHILLHTQESMSENAPPIEAFATDISAHGIGIMCSTPLPTDMKLILILQGNHSEITVPACVRWSQKVPISGRIIREEPFQKWRIGIQLNFRSKDEEEAFRKIAQIL